MKGLKRYIILALLASGLKTYAQQGIQFTQYAFSGLTVNPAYAGYKEDWTLNVISRLQWTGIDGAPRTGAISVDGLTDDNSKRNGLGLVIIGDQLGPQTTSTAYVNYAYRLRLNEEDTKRLSFGLGVGASQYIVDYSKFNATDPTDPQLGTGSVSKISPDFRFGIFYTSSSFYLGASAVNLLADAGFKDNTAVIREARSFYFTGGYLLPLNQSLDFKPSLLVKEDFKGPTNVDLTANFLINRMLWLGATYRTGVKAFNKTALQGDIRDYDALAGIVQFYVNDKFRIGYSYDFNIGKLATYQNGTHELSIGISFSRRKERVLSPRYF